MREYLNDAIQRSLTDHLLEKIKVIEIEWAKEYPNFKK